MNTDILYMLRNNRLSLHAEDRRLRDLHASLKANNRPVSEINEVVRNIRSVDAEYERVGNLLNRYQGLYSEYEAETDPEAKAQIKAEFDAFERRLATALGITLNNEAGVEAPVVPEEEEEEEEIVAVAEPKKKNTVTKVIAGTLALALAGGVGYCIGSHLNNDTVIVQEQDEEEEEKPFESYGEFTDASDREQVEKRAQVYFDEYIAPVYGEMSETERASITPENLADIIQVVNGEVPEGFDTNEVINYNNRLVQMFCSYLSTDERTKNGEIGFMPSAYLYEDGSHEQKCALELDAIMEPLIKAINEGDDYNYIKYATEFGELMRDQFYLVDNTDEHFNVRSIASYPSRIHLYGLAYSYYTTSIMEYGLTRNMNICIPFCIDYETKEIVNIPLSQLMATLEFVPMSQWDAVLQRSGISISELEKMGNDNFEETMPYAFTQDAKGHFREEALTLTK